MLAQYRISRSKRVGNIRSAETLYGGCKFDVRFEIFRPDLHISARFQGPTHVALAQQVHVLVGQYATSVPDMA
eukprot:3940799-Rhodomonas_salina.2